MIGSDNPEHLEELLVKAVGLLQIARHHRKMMPEHAWAKLVDEFFTEHGLKVEVLIVDDDKLKEHLRRLSESAAQA